MCCRAGRCCGCTCSSRTDPDRADSRCGGQRVAVTAGATGRGARSLRRRANRPPRGRSRRGSPASVRRQARSRARARAPRPAPGPVRDRARHGLRRRWRAGKSAARAAPDRRWRAAGRRFRARSAPVRRCSAAAQPQAVAGRGVLHGVVAEDGEQPVEQGGVAHHQQGAVSTCQVRSRAAAVPAQRRTWASSAAARSTGSGCGRSRPASIRIR